MSTLAVNAVTDANGGNTATINSMTPTADRVRGSAGVGVSEISPTTHRLTSLTQ